MAVTPDDIAVELGRATPLDQTTREQWASWIARAYRKVERRAERMGVDYATLDPDTVDDVVTYAVARRASRPLGGAESVTDQVSVDDGSVNQTRRYASGQGDLYFLDQWWADLGLLHRRRAFSVRMAGRPGYRP